VPEPPAATTAPSVVGNARRGATLSVRVGTWTNAPTSYAYQWQRLIASGWEDIEGAKSATYVANSEDLGRRLRVAVIATNRDGASSAASAQTASIGANGVNRAATSTRKGKGSKSSVKASTSSKAKKKQAAKRKAAARKKAAAKKKAAATRQ